MASTAGQDEKAGCAVLCQNSAPLSQMLCLLRMGLWPARSAKALSCATAFPETVGKGFYEVRGEYKRPFPEGQSPPTIDTYWLDLSVLLDRFSFELADKSCYQGLQGLQMSAILCQLCRVIHPSFCSKPSLTSLSGTTSFWFI